jgi:hypothetical protein
MGLPQKLCTKNEEKIGKEKNLSEGYQNCDSHVGREQMTNRRRPPNTMEKNNSNSSSITIHLSLTSSPSSPRIDLVLDSSGGSSISALELQTKVSKVTNIPLTGKTFF